MSKYNFIIPEKLEGFRVDKAISIICGDTSRSLIQKAIKNQHLLLNGKILSNLSAKVKENDNIEIFLEKESKVEIQAINISLDIIYEDEDLIVINKPATIAVHPGAGAYKETLVNALLYHSPKLSDIGGEIRPGIVHRLDKNTSGLMVVAKNNAAHIHLAAQIESRTLKRRYKALIWGMLRPQEGAINALMARSKLDRKKMTTVKSGGKIAITRYKTLEIFKSGIFSLVECRLETGRTHQIRVHLSHAGHSIVGDQTYGNNKRKIIGCPENLKEILAKFDHQALHSFYISFVHPTLGTLMEFEKEVPADYSNLLSSLK